MSSKGSFKILLGEGKIQMGVMTEDNTFLPLEVVNDRVVELPSDYIDDLVLEVEEKEEDLDRISKQEPDFELDSPEVDGVQSVEEEEETDTGMEVINQPRS